MRKVKEYLDKNFFSVGAVETKERSNGHLGVFGYWKYPKDYETMSHEEFCLNPVVHTKSFIWCSCNNETLQIFININGKHAGYYGYLQTYEHIPRGLPDSHGYFARCTDEEVINYIDTYYQKIAQIRKKKLLALNEIQAKS